MFYEIFFLWWIMEWKWKYFKPEEIACKGKICRCGRELWDKAEYGENMPNYLKGALDTLDMLRGKWGKPIVLNSAHRCAKHNASVGGAKNSRHLKIAFDCRVAKQEQEAFIALAEECGFTGIGVYENFVHLDLGKKRKWKGSY